jgi:hypothetical protein
MEDTILAARRDETASPVLELGTDGRVPIGFAASADGQLMTSLQVAKALNVSQRWVTDKHGQGHLKGYRLPGSRLLRFDWDEVVECLEQNGGE